MKRNGPIIIARFRSKEDIHSSRSAPKLHVCLEDSITLFQITDQGILSFQDIWVNFNEFEICVRQKTKNKQSLFQALISIDLAGIDPMPINNENIRHPGGCFSTSNADVCQHEISHRFSERNLLE